MLKAASPTCPFCESDSEKLFEKNDVPILECLSCRHRFVTKDAVGQKHVDVEFDDTYFFGGERCYEDYSVMAEDLRRKGSRYAKILKQNLIETDCKTPRILDVGCAAGYLLQGFVDQGWQGAGIEANQSMANYGRDQLGLDVKHSTVENFAPRESFDAVSLVQVLTHLINPDETLDAIHSQLSDNGLLMIETWSCGSLTAKAFGESWHQYNPPSVLHWFSRHTLINLLEEHGFEIVQQGRPVKWISLGNGLAALRKSLSHIKLMKHLLSPLQLVPSSLKVPYFLDDVFWIVARKRSA